MKTFISTSTKHKVTRVSRWIEIRHNYNPNHKNGLWNYVTDGNGYTTCQSNFNPDGGLYLDFFRWNNRNYAIGQFVGIGSVWCAGLPETFIDTDGKLTVVGFVDFGGDIFNPIYIEIDEYGERVRVYTVD